jgi:hypothetical protein
MFCQLQDQGGVGVSTAIQAVTQEIADVQTELKGVVEKINQEEANPKASQDEKRLERLSQRERDLRAEKARLQEEKLILLRQSGANSTSVHLLPPLPFSLLPSRHRIIPLPSLAFLVFASFFPLPNVVGVVHLFACGSSEVFSACSFVCSSVSTDSSRLCGISRCHVSSCDFSICVTSVFVHFCLLFVSVWSYVG